MGAFSARAKAVAPQCFGDCIFFINTRHHTNGLHVDQNGKTAIHPQETEIVGEIFRGYLDGNSLGKITDMLHEQGILSPSGADRWSRASIDYILSNKWYVLHLVDPEYFAIVQAEKERRVKHEGGSLLKGKDVLSGMLICAECGAKYSYLLNDLFIIRTSPEIAMKFQI